MISHLAHTRRSIATGALLCLAMAAGGCAAFDDDTGNSGQSLAGETEDGSDEAASDGTDTTTVCGREVVPSPAVLPIDPCQRGEVVLDDTFAKRTRGEPDETTTSFEVDKSSNVCIHLDNIAGRTPTGSNGGASDNGNGEGNGKGNGHGEGRGTSEGDAGDDSNGTAKLSAAWVYVDGRQIAGPEDFNQNVDDLRRTIDVPAGRHEVRIKLASKPGAKLGVTVQAADLFDQAEDHPTTTGQNGILEVSNVAVDHPMVSPNGDDYHDTALFHADNLPDDSQLDHQTYEYHLEWSWSLIDADACNTVDAGITGTTRVHSPTDVQAHWDGTDTSGSTVDDGKYLYEYQVDLVRSDGTVVDSATATARGLVIDSSTPSYDPVEFDGTCTPDDDPNDCKCPDSTPDGVRCTFTWIPYLDHFDDLSNVDTSEFVTTTKEAGRYEVVVDLRTYNGGGLVPQTDGTYASLQALQDYVSTLTGVPPDPNDTRLFNFDYAQLGYATPVTNESGTLPGFNHFLLDVITDQNGEITVDGETFDVRAMLQSTETSVPEGYVIRDRRTGEACAENGNTDGETSLKAKACTHVRTANLDPGDTNLGIYTLQSRMFDVRFDGEGTERGTHCIINGIFKCGVRTFQRNAELTAAGQEYLESDSGSVRLARDVETIASDVPSLVVHSDRQIVDDGTATTLDGVCSRSLASGDGMSTPLDSATGAVSPTCIINGIF